VISRSNSGEYATIPFALIGGVMGETRTISRILPGRPVTDGGGVPVRRTIGDKHLETLDPFLLFDELKSGAPGEHDAGLPKHPHRGLQTITYVIDGELDVRDSHGNFVSLTPGMVQWAHAGTGIIHDELPKRGVPIRAIQFWLNVPGREKMSMPQVQTLAAADIPTVELPMGGTIRVIAGSQKTVSGPIVADRTKALLLDVNLPRGSGVSLDIPADKVAMLYVLQGRAMFGITGTSTGEMVGRGHLILLSQGDVVKVLSGHMGARFLVVGAIPIGEPICRYGPMAMNTAIEIEQAVAEYHAGTFDLNAPVQL
jgi:redox-sensitive bicupin YhaK (pirin superfamily)